MLTIVGFISVLLVGSASGWEVVIDDPQQDEVLSGSYNVTGRVVDDFNDTGEIGFVNISIGGGEMPAKDGGNGFYDWFFEWDTGQFSDGEYTITAYVYVVRQTGGGGENGSGEEWSLEDYVTVDVEVDNKVPVAFIDSITPNSTVVGNVVTFNGHGQPPLGRTIVDYEWRSYPGDDHLSNVSSFSTSTLSVGTHTVRFTVWDSEGMKSQQVTMDIEIRPPDGDEWPTFHGDYYRTGVSPDGPEDGNVMWNFSTDSVDSDFHDPVVYHDRVYIAESVDTGTTTFGVIHALDVNGTFDDVQGEAFGRADLIWNFTLPEYALAAPSVRDGKVFIGTQWSATEPNFYALNAYNGAHLWNHTTNGHIWSSPAVTAGMVVLTDFDGKVTALDPSDGDLLWRTDLGYPILSSPTIAGGRIYILSSGGNLDVLDASDGDPIASTDLGGSHTFAPVFHDDRIFLTARGDGSNDVLMARNRFDISDEASGSWSYTPGGRIASTPVTTDHALYVVLEAGTVICVDLDGNPEWTLELNRTVSGSMALGGSLLYVPVASGELIAVDIDDHSIEWTVNVTDDPTSPAIGGDLLFLGSEGYAYAIWESSIPIATIDNIEVELIPELPETHTWYRFAVDYDPFTVSENITLRLNGSATDPEGLAIVGYEWSYTGGGTFGDNESVTAKFGPGSHVIKFRVKNEDDIWSSYSSIPLIVNPNERPVVDVTIDYPYVGEYSSFDLRASNDTDGGIEIFRIDFGDGSDVTFWTDPSNPATHVYTSKGNYSLRIWAYDDHGLVSAVYERNVAITNRVTTDGSPSDDGDKEGAIDQMVLLAAIGGLVAVLVVIALLFVVLPRRSKRREGMVEFEEDEVKQVEPMLDIDEKEEKLAEIAARLGEEKVLGAKAKAPRGRRRAPPKRKKTGAPSRKPAAKPRSRPGPKPAEPEPEPEEAPEPAPVEEPEPEPEREPEPEPGEEPKGSGRKPKDLSEKRSSLEDLLSDLEEMKK